MWKRIHSNRDPRDTLYSELRKEFSTYFNRGGAVLNQALGQYPKFFFGVMVLAMAVSLVLSFTLFRDRETVAVDTPRHQVNPVQDGFSQIMEATDRIRESLRLKQQVDSISAKKQLSTADSLFLVSALTRLQREHQIKK